MVDLYGPMRDRARKFLKSLPNLHGVPSQDDVDGLTTLLAEVVDDLRTEDRARIAELEVAIAALLDGRIGAVAEATRLLDKKIGA
jgi:hypothetical protein